MPEKAMKCMSACLYQNRLYEQYTCKAIFKKVLSVKVLSAQSCHESAATAGQDAGSTFQC